MTTFTINSRKHGPVHFSAPEAGGYARVTSAKWDHLQICHGGSFGGSTISASASTLESVARRWWASFLAAEREFGF